MEFQVVLYESVYTRQLAFTPAQPTIALGRAFDPLTDDLRCFDDFAARFSGQFSLLRWVWMT